MEGPSRELRDAALLAIMSDGLLRSPRPPISKPRREHPDRPPLEDRPGGRGHGQYMGGPTVAQLLLICFAEFSHTSSSRKRSTASQNASARRSSPGSSRQLCHGDPWSVTSRARHPGRGPATPGHAPVTARGSGTGGCRAAGCRVPQCPLDSRGKSQKLKQKSKTWKSCLSSSGPNSSGQSRVPRPIICQNLIFE